MHYKYASDSTDVSAFKQLCEKAGVPTQTFVNRSDQVGGSTIGAVSASHLPIRTVDTGAAMLSMHSIRETMGTKDYEYFIKVFKEFYNL